MDFWNVYETEKRKEGFGSSRAYITSRDRIHLSLSTVEQYGSVLEMNQATTKRYKEEERFVLITEMTRDLFVSVYDVNTTHSVLLRFSTPLEDSAIKQAVNETKKLSKPNMEMRIIGMQNGDSELLPAVERFHGAFRSSLMEIDLFGNETRHLVFDTKLGMTFNLLLLNRIYKPGELVNSEPIDEFNKKKSELKFV